MLIASAGLTALATVGGIRSFFRRADSSQAGASQLQYQYEVEPTSGGSLVVRRKAVALGAPVALTAIHDRLDVAVEAIDAAFAELERIESVMSVYRPESELSRLNAAGRLERPDTSLIEVLRFAAEISRATDGAFDVTVQPLWQLYAEAQRSGRLPGDEQLDAALSKVNWASVQIARDEIHLPAGAAITLNGIAQGYAADRALCVMRNAGVEHALIDSGEFAPLGRNRRGEPWSVGIQHPRQMDALAAVARLDGRCLATSGDYATTFSADRRHNHLFDPKSGKSPVGLMSASIVAPTAMEADALSTACFVMGIEEARRFIASRPGCDAFFVASDGSHVRTPGFPLSEEVAG